MMGHSTFVCTLHFSIVLAILAVPILGPRARVLRGSVSDLRPVWRVSEAAGVDRHHFFWYYRYRSQNMQFFRQNQVFITTKIICQNIFQFLPLWVRWGEVWRFANLASQHCRPVSPGLIPRYLLNHRDKNYPPSPASGSPPILHVVYFQNQRLLVSSYSAGIVIGFICDLCVPVLPPHVGCGQDNNATNEAQCLKSPKAAHVFVDNISTFATSQLPSEV